MSRPCKSAKVLSESSQTKDEIQERVDNEEKLKGKADKVNPPEYLNENQVDLFNYIKNELEESKLLSNLDIYILSTCVIAIDRLQQLESMLNQNNKLMFRSEFMSAKDKYTKDLYRCSNELSLSPQSRAKLANINLQANENKKDPLMQVINGSGKGE
jgi:P27 family predicted phage terminase small subunit